MKASTIAFCGLNCHKCLTYIATINDDDNQRIEIAIKWSKLYHNIIKTELKPEDINCKGCKVEKDAIFIGCRVCPIRECCNEKQFQNCAFCEDHDSCEILNGFYDQVPEPKKRLDKIREGKQ